MGLCSFAAHANDKDEKERKQQQTEKKLSQVQAQIKKKHAQISKQTTEQGKIEKALKQTDLQIGQTAKSLRETRAKLADVKLKLKTLESKKVELEEEKSQQLEVLSAQVKSAYQVGHHDYLMMLLNQESPGKLERVLSYYQYLNKARVGIVESLKATITELDAIKLELDGRREQLAELLTEQLTQETELNTYKQKQKKALARLKKVLHDESRKLARLKESETALTETINELAEAIAQLPTVVELTGLAKYMGKLAWPAEGKVRQLFGKRKRGPLRWKGNRIDTKLGSAVNAIHAGQVIFSDWMKGVGLVMVIDHGEGYMSLYGHNQTLLKDVGEMVEPGEPIALVGQSGGQNFPNLYFEIRHKGKPVDPKKWCRSY
ncbi:peptidoglycan DD-metalloendopeptidase family protein [Catenovulum sp. SM1970]|uniref:murein hydrolase activator EnvC family protein n=1 Tax=Marinifaba aquimaris TaxID=2741323 RepID=UPI001573C191|nr:peptidoglycan DD-metalloendopeptidase family protein [Marinifaba aquimaris]NTS77233.1 peptidoglycan DD-metalloendopeptidase family protein [Marinifaba aquimaris]